MLAANDRAPGKARSFTREALTAWGVEDLLDQAVLIVSELTTNAERHGRTADVGVDQEAARRAGVSYVHAGWGYGTPSPPAAVVAESPKDLLPLMDTGPLLEGSLA